MTNSRILKIVTGILELVLGIPIVGGLIVMGFSYVPLGIMFVLHLITLLLSIRDNEVKYGSILGLVTSVLAAIPILGMILHIITGIVLLISAFRNKA